MKKIIIISKMIGFSAAFSLNEIEEKYAKLGNAKASLAFKLGAEPDKSDIVTELALDDAYLKDMENVNLRTLYLRRGLEIVEPALPYIHKKMIENASLYMPIDTGHIKTAEFEVKKFWHLLDFGYMFKELPLKSDVLVYMSERNSESYSIRMFSSCNVAKQDEALWRAEMEMVAEKTNSSLEFGNAYYYP